MTNRPPTDPTAVVARRGGAWFIDVVLCALAAAVPALLLADAYALDRAADGIEVEWHDGDLGVFVRDTVIVMRPVELAITGGALLAAALLLLVVLPGRRGWSPGHLAADLRLVRADGRRVGVGRALVRTVAWVVDGLPGLPLVAYGSARSTRRHQRVGDLLARTFVVDKRADGQPVDRPLEDDGIVAEAIVEPAPEPEPDGRHEAEAEPSSAPEEAPVEPDGDRPPAGVPADQPLWDRRQKRYVLWHSKRRRWLAHSDQGWRPLAPDEQQDTPTGGGNG